MGMFELQAGLLKTRVFDALRGLPTPSKVCRVCHRSGQTVKHLVAGCSAWFFTYYKERHDAALRPLCWWLRHRYGLDESMRPWHAPVTPDPISENEEIRIWWDVPVYTDVKLEHNRPVMRVWLKKRNKLFVVEMSTPYDENVKARQEEKDEKYVPLAAELASECRGAEVLRVTLVIGALGSVMGLELELDWKFARRPISPKAIFHC